MAVEVDLFRDFVEQVRTNFNIDPEVDELDVIRMYAWFYLRRLPIKKWNVYYSNELKQNSFYVNNGAYIDRIRDKAKAGEDLTPHASTLLENIQAKDDMLADWGIYHLHPGHGTRAARSSGFVNRAGELLFVFPDGHNLYFLDVLDHRSWTNYSLIEIIDNNWPAIINQYRLNDVIELAYEPTEQELYELRKNQVNAFFRVGRSFFIGPGGGLATNGASNRAVKMALNVKKLLNDYSKQLQEEEADIRKKIEEKVGGNLSFDPLSLKLLKYDPKNGTGEITEKNSDIVFTLSFA